MSFTDSLQFPRTLTVIRASENQSEFTRFFTFSGKYYGSLPGIIVSYPRQSPGAHVMMVRKPLYFNVSSGVSQNIEQALSDYAYGYSNGVPSLGMTQTYIPIIQPSGNPGTANYAEWASTAWDPDSTPQVLQNTNFALIGSGGTPYTVAGRTVGMYQHLVKNTISTSSVAISGTCNAARIQCLDLEGDVDISVQYVKRYASPDKDFVAAVPLQAGVCSVGGVDWGLDYVPTNPWASSGDRRNELTYRSKQIEMQIFPIIWSFSRPGLGATAPYTMFTDGGGVLSPPNPFWAIEELGADTPNIDQEVNGRVPGNSFASTQLWISPYVNQNIVNEQKSHIVDKCPPANPFDCPDVGIQWRVATTSCTAWVTIRAVFVFAEHSYAVGATENTATQYTTTCETKRVRVGGSSTGGWQNMSTIFERPVPAYTENTSTLQGQPRRGLWVGTYFYMWGSFVEQTQEGQASFTAYFERYTCSYRFKVDNPAHVCAWDAKSTADTTPLIVEGSVLSEVRLSSEARAYANVSTYPRSIAFDDMTKAQAEFLFHQRRKTSGICDAYNKEEEELARALRSD